MPAPIKNVTTGPHTVLLHCVGYGGTCGHEMSVALSDLQLGVDVGAGMVDNNTIVLPECTACGSGRSLTRTWDVTPDDLSGSPHDRLRLTVNAIAKYLRDNGHVHPSSAAAVAAETEEPPDVGTLPTDLSDLWE